MANEHKIEINKRDDITPQGLKQLRRMGNIPGIYYSPTSKNSIPIFITQNNYHDAIKSGARIFNIIVDNKKQNVLFKAVQYHPVTEEVLHLDLYGIRMDQAITIKVTLQLTGDAVGVKDEGGILNQPLNEIEIQCLPADIPDFFELDISNLSIGDSLNAYDIEYKDFNVLEDPDIRLKLSEHSNWPTIPQLFVNGELVGGCDIIVELFQNGELKKILGLED